MALGIFNSPLSRLGKYLATIHLDFKEWLLIIPSSPFMVTVRVFSKLKTSWKSVGFTNKVGKNSRYFVSVFNKTIIQLALVGYELSTVSYPTCTRGIWIANFLVAPSLCFKARLSAKPFSQERFTLSLVFKVRILELGNGLLLSWFSVRISLDKAWGFRKK